MPGLFPSRPVGQGTDLLLVFGRVFYREFSTVDFQKPGVGVSRRNTFGGEEHRKLLRTGIDLTGKSGVVPRFTRNHLAFAIGPLPDDIGEHGVDMIRYPSETERQVKDMHTQIPHAAILAIDLHHPLPVDHLLRIEIAAVPETCFDLHDLSKALISDHLVDSVRAGAVRSVGRASK